MSHALRIAGLAILLGLTITSASARASEPINFDHEDYLLKNNATAADQATTDIREYLREGEDWDGYRKMVAVRMMSEDTGVDAAALAQATIAETKKNYPASLTRELVMKPEHAVIGLIIVAGDQVEFNLFDYRRVKKVLVSAQFVLRNKPPFDTQEKFTAEQDSHFDDWVKQLDQLSAKAARIVEATRGQAQK